MLNHIYIMPHGDEIIDMPNNESIEMNNTIKNVTKNDNSIKVIISPHGLRLDDKIGIYMSYNFKGYYKTAKHVIKNNYKNEIKLTENIHEKTKYVSEGINYITSGENSYLFLDFGTMIPLKFFNKSNITVIGEPRFNDKKALINFGSDLYNIINNYDEKISLIISADQAHTHNKNGPYGYSPMAEKYEDMVKNWIINNDDTIINFDNDIINKAKPDSYWNMLILYGFIKSSKIKLKLDYSYVQEYFGMLFAYY